MANLQCQMGKLMEINLFSGAKCLIDNEDWFYLKNYKWTTDKDNYVRAVKQVNYKQKQVLMHRLIMCPKDHEIIDHINMNPLDNRKQNLRITDRGGNSMNRKKQKGQYYSKHKGVSFNKKLKKWRAHITFRNAHIHLGTFASEVDAALAYNKAAIKYFGTYARLNKL